MKRHVGVSLLTAVLMTVVTVCLAQPYEPSAIWEREGVGDSSLYGTSILALGDQNNDGFNDWAVFALGNANDTYHGAQPGYVEFFHGGIIPDSLPHMVRNLDMMSETALWRAVTVGDINGDGYTDWIIVAERNDGSYDWDSKIYFGGPGPHNQPDVVVHSVLLGKIGDVNGDGFSDLWGIYMSNIYQPYVWYGGTVFDTIPAWTGRAFWGGVYPGDANGDQYGDYLVVSTNDNVDLYLGGNPPDTLPAYHWNEWINDPAILPDVNGGGIGDLAFTVAGGVEIRFGGSAIHMTPDAFLHFPGCSPHRVFSAGDFNHDGYNDIAMISPFCDDSWYGKLAVHLGGSWLNPEPAFMIYGWEDPFNLIGIKTAVSLGDINGDGIDDLGVGANHDVVHAGWRGKAIILAGDTSLHVAVDPVRPELPDRLDVSVYPNPFNNRTTVKLDLPLYAKDVHLTLYNVLGQAVRSIALNDLSSTILYSLDASDLPTGLYLLRASSGSLTTSAKLIVLK